MALIDHFGTTPGSVCTALLSALSVFQFANGGAGGGGTGCVRTIKRFAGDEMTPARIDHLLAKGIPAMLVAYSGGSFSGGTNLQRMLQTMQFSIICAAGRFTSRDDRLAGDTPLIEPGIEDMLDWSIYYGMRALGGLAGIHAPRAVGQKWLRIEPGKYLAVAELECQRRLDVYDDDAGNALESLGIVHDPVDYDDLWDPDNTTPNSERPRTVDGGVAEL